MAERKNEWGKATRKTPQLKSTHQWERWGKERVTVVQRRNIFIILHCDPVRGRNRWALYQG
jgi:hypothetical protein